MKKADKFLDLYREYETVLRDQGIDYKTREDGSDDMMQNRLRINRQIRNYLTHNHDIGFLEVSDSQIKFMEKLIKDQKMQNDILKKHTKTPAAASCNMSDKCSDVMTKMSKLKVEYMPVCDDNGIVGLVSIYDVATTLLANTKTVKIAVITKVIKKVRCIQPDVQMSCVEQFNDAVICCTDTGDMSGKLLGVYFND